MKWFRHMSNSHDDEKLCLLIDKMGFEGYGYWWLLLELIATQMNEDKPPILLTSLGTLSRHFRKMHHQSTLKVLEYLASISLISLRNLGENLVEIEIPNLSKFKDEWTRKKSKNSGVAPESLRSYTEQNRTEHSITEEINTPPTPPAGGDGMKKKKSKSPKAEEKNQLVEQELFGTEDNPNGIWQLWTPARRGTKSDVLKAYKSVRKESNVAAIRAGAEEYMRSAYVTSRVETQNTTYIKTLAAWLREQRWELAGTGAWDEPCQEWKRIHASEQPGFNYNGPCRVINFAPRDGTLG